MADRSCLSHVAHNAVLTFAYVSEVSATRSCACALAVQFLQLKFPGSLSVLKLMVHSLFAEISDVLAAVFIGCIDSRVSITQLNR